MLKIYQNKKKRIIYALILIIGIIFTFSCCASKKKINKETSAYDINYEADSQEQSQEKKNVESLYSQMLKDAEKHLSFSETVVNENPIPQWLVSVNDEKEFLYAIGISPKTAGEQRSRELALLDVQKKLYAHGIKKNYTHVSTYTQSAKNEEGKKYFVTAVLVRVPRENNQKNTEDLL
ncbi:MAG: hypothetical protein IJ688_09285 [Treponema sp.]|nr:hypothetical protein [Treponema sp.]